MDVNKAASVIIFLCAVPVLLCLGVPGMLILGVWAGAILNESK